jgi:hypothetical protein
MDEQVKLGFEFAKALGEQLITLSTGILALSITFTKDLVSRVPPRAALVLGFSWLLYVASILCGLDHLMALTGQLAPRTTAQTTTGVAQMTTGTVATAARTASVATPVSGIGEIPRAAMVRQLGTFVLATLLMLAYGFLGLRYWRRTSQSGSRTTPPEAAVINPT